MIVDTGSPRPKVSSSPPQSIDVFKWSTTKKLVFPVCLLSCEFMAFSQVIVYCPRQNAQINDLQQFKIPKRCSSNPSSVFHPELPVIPKPGVFKTLFIWKKTACETQQKPTITYTFTWQHAFYFLFWNNSQPGIWIVMWKLFMGKQTHQLMQFANGIVRFINFGHSKYN